MVKAFPGKEQTLVERAKIPYISIYDSGEISMNMVCREEFFKGFDYVILGYDDKTEQIGFQPAKQQSKNTYPIRPSKDNRYFLISGRGLLTHYKISPLGYQKVIPQKEGDWIVIKPKEKYPFLIR